MLGGILSACGSVRFCCRGSCNWQMSSVGTVGQQNPSVQYLPFSTQIWDMSDEETV